MYHVQKDGSEFSDVTLASEDDNDNSNVIVLKKLFCKHSEEVLEIKTKSINHFVEPKIV